MVRAGVYSALLVVAAAVLVAKHDNEITIAIAAGIIAGVSIPLAEDAVSNARYLRLAFQSLICWRTEVRISASYLFRIQVDDSFLIVRGHRFPQFQPVGGVFKTNERGAATLRQWSATNDSLIPFDRIIENDLRIRIKGRYLIPFLHWFESGKGRETSPWREFQEELIGSDILPSATFPYIFHEYIRRHIHPLRYSVQAESKELLIADIIEFFPTPEQMAALRELKSRSHPDVRWVTAKDIGRRSTAAGLPEGEPIAMTATWTL